MADYQFRGISQFMHRKTLPLESQIQQAIYCYPWTALLCINVAGPIVIGFSLITVTVTAGCGVSPISAAI